MGAHAGRADRRGHLGGSAIGVAVGLFNALIIVGVGVNPLVATIGTGFAIRGIAFIWTGGLAQDYFTDTWLNEVGNGEILGIRTPIVIAVSVFVVVALAMRFTRFGGRVYAIGGASTHAHVGDLGQALTHPRLCAQRPLRCARRIPAHGHERNVVPAGGVWRGTAVLGAVIIGGTGLAGGRGTVFGTLLGVLLLGTLQNGFNLLGVQSYWQTFIQGVILIVAVTADEIRRRAKGRWSATQTLASGGDVGRVVLQTRGIGKKYGSITAVDGVDVDIYAGEIMAIVGDNGAGKSTMIKMLCGAIQPDSGELSIEGREGHLHLGSPHAAREMGIETVFQDLALAPNRDVVSTSSSGARCTTGASALRCESSIRVR